MRGNERLREGIENEEIVEENDTHEPEPEPLSLEEARNVMRKLGLKSGNEFRKLKRHKGTLPKGIAT